MNNQIIVRKFITLFLPHFLICIWSGYIFFEKGLPAGTDQWRFFASLAGFVLLLLLLVSSLFVFIKKNKINFSKIFNKNNQE